jgi:hypothetical protein
LLSRFDKSRPVQTQEKRPNGSTIVAVRRQAAEEKEVMMGNEGGDVLEVKMFLMGSVILQHILQQDLLDL